MSPAGPPAAQPVVGVVGADVPRQVVLAAGALPRRIFGSWRGDPGAEAAELLGAVDAVTVRILDELLAGMDDGIAGLVVCNDSAASLRLFYVLRILAERGRVPFPVRLLDAPRGGGPARDRFVARQYARLRDFCGEITGKYADAAALGEAAGREREVGAALERMRQRRRAGRCSGVAALGAYREAAQQPPEAAISAIESAGAEGAVIGAAATEAEGADAGSAAGSAVAGAPRVVVTGSAHPDERVYAAIESAGLVVAGEDHDSGDAGWLGEAFEPDSGDLSTGDAVLLGLARMHAERPPLAARSLSRERARSLTARVTETGASGVLALIRELDDAPAWDVPAQRTATGVPFEVRQRLAPGEAVTAATEAACALGAALRGADA